MEVLGIRPRELALASFLCLVISLAMFLPVLQAFPQALAGSEDMRLFIWIFWHYESRLDAGMDPLQADELFYPYGISLAKSSTSPLQSMAYYLMPDSLGVFGRITLLQLASYVLGGIFSFVLLYRFSRSFWPSMAGTVIFNFSVFHFEKVLHHLNYAMAFPLVALLFIFYLDFAEGGRKKSLLLLSLSLLLLSLDEITLAIMAGFVIFIDIMMRYRHKRSEGPLTPVHAVILCVSVVVSLVLYEALAFADAPPAATFTLPPLVFISACIIVIGPAEFVRAEKEAGQLRAMLAAAIPVFIYIALIAIRPGYSPDPDRISVNLVLYPVPVSYLLIPSDLQAISAGLEAESEHGVYFGIVAALLLAGSAFIPGAGGPESRFRNLAIIFILFSFPMVSVLDSLSPTPFIAQPLFPLLSVLRVSARFMLFALLFSAISISLFLSRLRIPRAALVLALLTLLLLAERWPDLGPFMFDPAVPRFYRGAEGSIFLFPNMDYFAALNEMYYQTAHAQPISGGIISRQPKGKNPLYPLYTLYSEPSGYLPEEIADTASGYDYIVVQKLECVSKCFYGEPVLKRQETLGIILEFMEANFGKPVYEDERMLAYRGRS